MRFPTVSRLAVFFAAAACPVASLAQQTPAQQAPAPAASGTVLHLQAREVVLPVTVRDKHGALVTTLQKSDFTLSEDGRPQVIKSFAHETNLPFRIGLLVDTSRSMSNVMQPVRDATGKFIDLMLPAPPAAGSATPAQQAQTLAQSKDEAFLIHFDRQVELLQDFTNSREKLHHELDGMSASREERYEGTDSGGSNGGSGSDSDDHQSHNRGGTQLYDAIFLASDELMKPRDGRKALVVFSDGGDRGSKETLNEAVDAADRANVVIYTIYFKGEQDHSNSGGNPGGGHRGGMGGGWPGGGGGGYPGGGGGRRGGQPSGANGVDGKKIMQEIAARTGGHAFEAKKKDDLEGIYKLIEEDLRNQYLLTYTPDKVDNEGGFHKIALKANKDDLIVATREGYYAPENSK
jgi:VWFA-related protein